jgi:hypothetical protein
MAKEIRILFDPLVTETSQRLYGLNALVELVYRAPPEVELQGRDALSNWLSRKTGITRTTVRKINSWTLSSDTGFQTSQHIQSLSCSARSSRPSWSPTQGGLVNARNLPST